MKKLCSFGVLLACSAVCASAQMHKVAKPETVVRAIGVYEWTGDLAKPNASRLIPVTLYIDKKLEDAGLYLARPVPFALQSGNIYELDEAGVPKGNLELVYARHLQAITVAEDYDDGWFGYGSFRGLVAPKKPSSLRKQPAGRIVGGETTANVDPDKPHFTNKAGQPVVPASSGDSAKPDASTAASSGTSADTPAADPDRPTMKRRTDTADSSTPASSGAGSSTPADDPDRPTMKRRSGNDTADTSTTASTPTSSETTSTTPADDPDRPTLKRHSVEDAKKKAKDPQSSVTGTGTLNDDPDRPNLHRGKPVSSMTEKELPKMSGLPVDLRQMIAVSDAANRPVHDFARAWDDDAERLAILAKMQGIAQAQLGAYAAVSPSSVAAATSAKSAAAPAARANSKMRRPVSPVRIVTSQLVEEQLKGYLLSYGDVPTFVYQAHTDGEDANLRYVTIVAQLDAQHEPKMVLHVVTDAAHLNRTARMRLVDAVDVEASNRASLLFEMRGKTSRQFGVYRVLGMQAEQIFTTGTMQ